MSKGPSSQTVTQQTQLPQYVSDAQQNLLGTVQNFTAPFLGSPSNLTAGFTPDQTMGFDLTRGLAANAFTNPATAVPSINVGSHFELPGGTIGSVLGGDPIYGTANVGTAQSAGAVVGTPQSYGANVGTAQSYGANLGTAQSYGANVGTAQSGEAATGTAQSYGANTGTAQSGGTAYGNTTRTDPSVGQVTGDKINALMNPYIGSVLDPTIAEMRRQLGITQQQIAAQGASSAAFGGSRQALQQSEANRAFGNQTALTIAQLMSQGFDKATATALANAQAAQQATQFDANALNNMSQFNAGAANNMTQFNANAANNMSQFNAGALNTAAAHNADAANNMSQFNAGAINAMTGRNMDAANNMTQFNTNALNTAGQYNANAANNMSLFNAGALNTAASHNADAANNMTQFNTNALNTAGQYNANAANNMTQFNTSALNNMAALNATAANNMSQFNAGALNNMSQYNAGVANNMDQFNASVRNAAIQRATQIAENDANRQLTAASLQNSVDSNQQQRQLAAIQALLGTGLQQQQTAQQNLNIPIDMLKLFGAAVPGSNFGGTASTTTPTQGSPIGSALGAIQAGNGLFGSSGLFPNALSKAGSALGFGGAAAPAALASGTAADAAWATPSLLSLIGIA